MSNGVYDYLTVSYNAISVNADIAASLDFGIPSIKSGRLNAYSAYRCAVFDVLTRVYE